MPLQRVRVALAMMLPLLCLPPAQASVDIWNSTAFQDITVRSAIADPTAPHRLLAATEAHGLYLSENSGGDWNPVTGLDALRITAMEFDLTWPGRVYAGDRSGQFFVSHNGGLDWVRLLDDQTLRNPTLPRHDIHEIHLTGTTGERLYVQRGGQLLETRDGGRSWRVVPAPLTNGGADTPPILFGLLALAPNNPDTLVALQVDGVYRSEDAGASWTFSSLISPQLPLDSLAISPDNPRPRWRGVSTRAWMAVLAGRRWTRA